MTAHLVTSIPRQYIGPLIYTTIGNILIAIGLIVLSFPFKYDRVVFAVLGVVALIYKWLNDIFDSCTVCIHKQDVSDMHIYTCGGGTPYLHFMLGAIFKMGITNKQFSNNLHYPDINIMAQLGIYVTKIRTQLGAYITQRDTSNLETQITSPV